MRGVVAVSGESPAFLGLLAALRSYRLPHNTGGIMSEELKPPMPERPREISDNLWAALVATWETGGREGERVVGFFAQFANQNLRLKGESASLLSRAEGCERALEVVAEALMEEAIDRDWCEEYDTFVESVNARAKMAVLKRMQRAWEVRAVVSLDITADSEESASNEAYQQMHSLMGVASGVSFEIDEVYQP